MLSHSPCPSIPKCWDTCPACVGPAWPLFVAPGSSGMSTSWDSTSPSPGRAGQSWECWVLPYTSGQQHPQGQHSLSWQLPWSWTLHLAWCWNGVGWCGMALQGTTRAHSLLYAKHGTAQPACRGRIAGQGQGAHLISDRAGQKQEHEGHRREGSRAL